jgi:hypothetical protein
MCMDNDSAPPRPNAQEDPKEAPTKLSRVRISLYCGQRQVPDNYGSRQKFALPMLRLSTLLLSFAMFAPPRAPGSDAPPQSAPLGLADLEARAPKENQYPTVNPQFHREVVRLVQSGALASAGDFLRASNIASGPFPDFRAFRMRYELTLAAAAKGDRDADSLIPGNWDALLQTLGRPMRFDRDNLVAQFPDNDQFAVDPAPKSIQFVMLHPGKAREIAAAAADNAEVQELVDADQAIRKRWNSLSEAEHRQTAVDDRRRNLRIREIVKSDSLQTARDFENASLVMQHSSGFSGYELAHELAVCSLLLGDKGMGRWLVAATYDRMLNSVGHEQRFGTQGALAALGDAKPHVADTDEAGICDAERLALGCPTLAAKRANFFIHGPKD